MGDSGPGPADAGRVFELGVTTKQAAGHGIGLALVRQTVTRLRGDLGVQGSTFEVTLPIAPAATAPTTTPTAVASPAASGEGATDA